MAGRITSQLMPVSKATSPVSTNVSGNLTDGALTPIGEGTVAGRGGCGLALVDMSKETSIRLFLRFAGETPFFESGVEMHGATVRPGLQHCARRE